MIPSEISEQHIRQAAKRIDRDGVDPGRESRYYDVVIDAKRHPPKYVVSLAMLAATGTAHPPTEFNAVNAKQYFENRGFEVIDRRHEGDSLVADEEDESSFPEGVPSYRMHRARERDAQISRKAKLKRLHDTGELACEVCGLEFLARYGLLASGSSKLTTPFQFLNLTVLPRLESRTSPWCAPIAIGCYIAASPTYPSTS